MNSRERWTVYPLVFLALGIALRDKITSTVEVKDIVCEKLTLVNQEQQPYFRLEAGGSTPLICEGLVVVGHDKRPLVKISADQRGLGQVVVLGPDGKAIATRLGAEPPAVQLQKQPDGPPAATHSFGGAGIIETYGFNGAAQVIIRSLDAAGAIETRTSQNVPQVVLQSNVNGGEVLVLSRDQQRQFWFKAPDAPPPQQPDAPQQPNQPQQKPTQQNEPQPHGPQPNQPQPPKPAPVPEQPDKSPPANPQPPVAPQPDATADPPTTAPEAPK